MTDRPPSGSPPADTAGVPWTGRELPRQPFAGDPGTADPALAARLAQLRAGTGGLPDVVRALAAARVLVPLVAVIGDGRPVPTHARGDLGADLALATITGSDGRRALPVFSAIGTLARWDAVARPVPVEAARAALAAVAEGCDLLVLDPAGPVPVTVPRPAVWALGQGRPWTPPGADGAVLDVLRAALDAVPEVVGLRTEPLGDAGVRVVLTITAGLSRAELSAVERVTAARLAEVDLLAERADALELRVLAG